MEEAKLESASSVVEVSISEMFHSEHHLHRSLYGALSASLAQMLYVVLMDLL